MIYFAMDEIGFESMEKIKAIASESDRWQFIYDTAKAYGFEGIHITPSLYESFELDLNNMPDYFQDFKLTFHFGRIYRILSENDVGLLDKELEHAFKIVLKHKMHDISVHPPYSENLTLAEKNLCLKFFHRIIEKWLKIALQRGISLSLETHVTSEYFVFDELGEYVKFIDMYPELGVLIDISHNYYNPEYSEEDMINLLGGKNVKGLHISDALRGADFRKGTHLAVGDGTVDFAKLLNHFAKIPDLYGVLEIKSSNGGISRSLKSLKEMLC